MQTYRLRHPSHRRRRNVRQLVRSLVVRRTNGVSQRMLSQRRLPKPTTKQMKRMVWSIGLLSATMRRRDFGPRWEVPTRNSRMPSTELHFPFLTRNETARLESDCMHWPASMLLLRWHIWHTVLRQGGRVYTWHLCVCLSIWLLATLHNKNLICPKETVPLLHGSVLAKCNCETINKLQ